MRRFVFSSLPEQLASELKKATRESFYPRTERVFKPEGNEDVAKQQVNNKPPKLPAGYKSLTEEEKSSLQSDLESSAKNHKDFSAY